MQKLRWYDKNSNLSEIFHFLENMDENFQSQIAQDILQILLKDFGLNLDAELNKISKDNLSKYNRWYDNNIDLFSSFEIIKNMPEGLQNEVVKRVVESVMLLYFSNNEAGGK